MRKRAHTFTQLHVTRCAIQLEGNSKDPLLQIETLRFREFKSHASTSEREVVGDQDLGGGEGWLGGLWWVFSANHGISEHGQAMMSGAGGEAAGRDLEGAQAPCL